MGAGNSSDMRMIYHLDEMERGGVMMRRFYYVPIPNSIFTLVIAVPLKYGGYRVNSSIEIKRVFLDGKSSHWR